MPHNRTATQWFCLLGGGLLVIRGVSVLVSGPSFDLPGEGWHASFHLVSGIVLLLASRRASLAYPVVVGFALVYGFVAVVGTVDGNEALGVIPIDTRDNVIHAVYVAIALAAIAAAAFAKRPGQDSNLRPAA
jgi:hypothetical protein